MKPAKCGARTQKRRRRSRSGGSASSIHPPSMSPPRPTRATKAARALARARRQSAAGTGWRYGRRRADHQDLPGPGQAGVPARTAARRSLASPAGGFQHPLSPPTEPDWAAPRRGDRGRTWFCSGVRPVSGRRDADLGPQASADRRRVGPLKVGPRARQTYGPQGSAAGPPPAANARGVTTAAQAAPTPRARHDLIDGSPSRRDLRACLS
jgi:hypothetical protein